MQHKFTQLSDFIKDIRFRINLKEDVQRREYHHMASMINFDKKNQPGFYDGVYSNKLIKKGLGAQLKDYIEGKKELNNEQEEEEEQKEKKEDKYIPYTIKQAQEKSKENNNNDNSSSDEENLKTVLTEEEKKISKKKS